MLNYIAVFIFFLSAVPSIGIASPEASPKVGTVKKGIDLTGDKVLVSVNGQPITDAVYRYYLNKRFQQIKQSSSVTHGNVEKPDEIMEKECLDQVIDLELLYQESKKEPVEDLEKRSLDQFKKYKEAFQDENAFLEALKQEGLTEQILKDLYLRNISIENYVKVKIAPQVTVSEGEVREFFLNNQKVINSPDQVRASHILVKTRPDMTSDEKKKRQSIADMIRKRVLDGDDFAMLAVEFSDDPGTKQNGGDLGFFYRGRFPPPFGDTAFSLEVGEVSQVIETRVGYHVILVTDKIAGKNPVFEEVESGLKEFIQKKRINKKIELMLEQLRANSEIVQIHSR